MIDRQRRQSGLLADSLPDRFGNALIDAWVATQGRSPGDFNAVERLCYVGVRGMGALEFAPATGPNYRQSRVEVAALVELAGDILTHRGTLSGSFAASRRQPALQSILRVGTSAGGARAKAIVARNQDDHVKNIAFLMDRSCCRPAQDSTTRQPAFPQRAKR